MAHDRVTTLGSGVDDAVLRISTTYDIRGLAEELTSYDNATVGSGSVVNEIVSEYDDLGLVSKEYQEHEGAKDANTLYVQYNRDTTASSDVYTKGLRPSSVRYPNARLVHFTYSTSGTTPDAVSRLNAIEDDNSGSPGDDLVEYTYLGTGSVVEVDYPEPDLRYDLDHGTPGDYDGLDRFGRVVDMLWYDYGSSADAVRIGHGYDRAGNRLYREDSAADANSVDVDELYGYDDVYQLTDLDRGDLNANKDGLTNGTLEFAEEWSLDMTGNWSTFKQDDDGDASWDLNQARDHNEANEIDEIDSSSTHVAHDKAGNMTKTPKPDNWSAHYDLTHDAWHRLVEVEDGENTVAEYAYDGRNFRTEKKTYDAGELDETRHFYYNSGWQCVEERIESGGSISANADQQYVWGRRYNDDLILRDRDTDSNATLDERLYALQDPNWNVVALSAPDGTINERYTYQAYGEANVLTAAFTTRATSSYDWETLYTGQRLDDETGLMYYRNRYYHPTMGRFVNRDPIGFASGDVNLYRYVLNIPVGAIDPTGEAGGYDSMDPSTPPIGGPLPLDRPPTDVEKLKGKCKCVAKNPKCGGCTAAACEKLVDDYSAAGEKTSVPLIDFAYLWEFWTIDYCGRWESELELRGGVSGLMRSPCVDKLNTELERCGWFGHPYAGHARYKVTLCDGTVFYVDNVFMAGTDHISL